MKDERSPLPSTTSSGSVPEDRSPLPAEHYINKRYASNNMAHLADDNPFSPNNVKDKVRKRKPKDNPKDEFEAKVEDAKWKIKKNFKKAGGIKSVKGILDDLLEYSNFAAFRKESVTQNDYFQAFCQLGERIKDYLSQTSPQNLKAMVDAVDVPAQLIKESQALTLSVYAITFPQLLVQYTKTRFIDELKGIFLTDYSNQEDLTDQEKQFGLQFFKDAILFLATTDQEQRNDIKIEEKIRALYHTSDVTRRLYDNMVDLLLDDMFDLDSKGELLAFIKSTPEKAAPASPTSPEVNAEASTPAPVEVEVESTPASTKDKQEVQPEDKGTAATATGAAASPAPKSPSPEMEAIELDDVKLFDEHWTGWKKENPTHTGDLSPKNELLYTLLRKAVEIDGDRAAQIRLEVARDIQIHLVEKHQQLGGDDAIKDLATAIFHNSANGLSDQTANDIFEFTHWMVLKLVKDPSTDLPGELLVYEDEQGLTLEDYYQGDNNFWSPVLKSMAALFPENGDAKAKFIKPFPRVDFADEPLEDNSLYDEEEPLLASPRANAGVDVDGLYNELTKQGAAFNDPKNLFRQALDAMKTAYDKTKNKPNGIKASKMVENMETLANAKKVVDAQLLGPEAKTAMQRFENLRLECNKNTNKFLQAVGGILAVIGLAAILAGILFISLTFTPVAASLGTALVGAAMETTLAMTIGGGAIAAAGGILLWKNTPDKMGRMVNKIHRAHKKELDPVQSVAFETL